MKYYTINSTKRQVFCDKIPRKGNLHMENYYNFGDILRSLRDKKGLTQVQLGELLGVQGTTISKYETNPNPPDGKTIRKISEKLGVSCDYLLGREPAGAVTFFQLTDEQIEIVKDLVELFREQNSSIKNKLTSEQYEMLGRITANFMKKLFASIILHNVICA